MKKDKVLIILMISVISILISILYLYSANKIGKIYQDETKHTIMNIKKSFIKNTVDNLIFEIELSRKNESELYEKYVDRRYETLILQTHLNEEEFIDYFIDRFNMDINKDTYLDYWTIFLWDNVNNTLIYDPENIVESDVNVTVENLKQQMLHYRIVNHGKVSGYIGVKQDFIDNRIKTITAEKIRELKFDNGSYIWVNEIINYDGGKNYAIRRVHPDLRNTEGMYLSTDMTDVKGNLLYLEELEGAKKYGEVYLEYYFNELDSDVISEKLSFLKLYKDFDWIIGMGIHIDDIQEYIVYTNEKSNEIAAKYISLFLLIFVAIVLSSLGFLNFLKNWDFKKQKNKIEQENNMDLLTTAFNRKYGTIEFKKAFNEFEKNGNSPAIMMFDIDNFKRINDTFGHAAGDQVLKDIISVVSNNIRNTDKLIRWGGDEFVCICNGLNKENAVLLARKLLSSVASMNISFENKTVKATISVGVSYIEKNDKDTFDVIKRADYAMYKSKEQGRNTVNIL